MHWILFGIAFVLLVYRFKFSKLARVSVLKKKLRKDLIQIDIDINKSKNSKEIFELTTIKTIMELMLEELEEKF